MVNKNDGDLPHTALLMERPLKGKPEPENFHDAGLKQFIAVFDKDHAAIPAKWS